MNDGAQVVIATGFFVAAVATVKAFSNVLIARAQAKLGAPDPLLDQRLARIEQAVDAIAVEVERISEGQRFTTRLLSDRGAERPRLPDMAGGQH